MKGPRWKKAEPHENRIEKPRKNPKPPRAATDFYRNLLEQGDIRNLNQYQDPKRVRPAESKAQRDTVHEAQDLMLRNRRKAAASRRRVHQKRMSAFAKGMEDKLPDEAISKINKFVYRSDLH